MRIIEYFNRNPRGGGWLFRIKGLKVGELVLVNGHVYRYGTERDGRDHVLTPVD